MGTIGITELVIIFLIIVVLFGARRIPELMRGLGSGIREFKKAAQMDEPEETSPVHRQALESSGSQGTTTSPEHQSTSSQTSAS